jgi:hypothetical protein
MRGIGLACCARAGSGHAAIALPANLMKSRRRVYFAKFGPSRNPRSTQAIKTGNRDL